MIDGVRVTLDKMKQYYSYRQYYNYNNITVVLQSQLSDKGHILQNRALNQPGCQRGPNLLEINLLETLSIISGPKLSTQSLKNIKPKTTIHPSTHVSIRYQQKRYQNNPQDSLLDLMLAIARAHASTCATSLMRVKNSMRHFCL